MIKINKQYSVIKIIYILIMLIMCGVSCAYITGETHQWIELGVTVLLTIIAAGLLFTDVAVNSPKIKLIISIILFVAMSYIILFAVLKNGMIEKTKFIAINTGIIFSICLILLAITKRSALALNIVTVLCFFITVANEEVMVARGTPILPTDIWAIGTASEVASEYRFVLNYNVVSVLACTMAILVIVNKLEFKIGKSVKALIARTACVLVAVGCMCVTFDNIEKANKSFSFSGFNIGNANKTVGVLATFAANVRDMRIEEPEGYSKAECEKLMGEDITNNNEDIPNVVVIMNEAFSDISTTYNIETSENTLEYFNSLKENTIRGTMVASVYGGSTSVTEFEFLTGMSNGIFNANITPYTQCVKGDINTICTDFENLGYSSVAIHPFWGKCWNRKYVYPMLGFNKAIFAEDFDENFEGDLEMGNHIMDKVNFGDFEYIRNYMSDRQSYKRVIEEFENKAEGEKKFIFNVTIQNHGGYKYKGKDFENTVRAVGMDNSELDQYLTLVKKSDEAYKELIEYFQNQEEPVVVLMFGDHQPKLTFEDGFFDAYDKNAKYEVPFVIWTNYDIEEEYIDKISPNYFSLLIKKAGGISYNGWDKLREQLMEKYPVINMRGAYTSEGKWININNSEDSLFEQYKNMEYYLFFDRGSK